MKFIKYGAGVTLVSTVVAVSANLLFANSQSTGMDDINTITTSGVDLTESMVSSPEGNLHTARMDTVRTARVNSMQKQIDALSRVVERLELRITQATVYEPGNEYSHESSTIEDEQNLAAQQWETYNSNEEDFTQQRHDPSWAIVKEEAFRKQISEQIDISLPNIEPLPENILDNLECRTTSCRLEVAAAEDMETIQEQLMLKSMGIFTSASVHYTDVGDAVIFYSDE